MRRRLTKLVVFLLLGAVVAVPLGIALDAILPLSRRSLHYSTGSIMFWLIGEGTDQQISELPDDDPTGFVHFICRSLAVDMSPIFATKTQETRVLHISLYRPSEQGFWGEQSDPWRPMLAEYLSVNGYDSWYVEGVLLPDVSRDRTIWIAVWGNGLIAVVVLYGIWLGSYRLVVWHIRLNRERA